MKPTVLKAVVGAAAVLLVASCTAGIQRGNKSQSADATELTAMDRSLLEATVNKDRAALERIYSDDFILLDDGSGEIVHKKQNIDEICSPDFKLDVLRGENYRVTVYGNIAYMTHDAHVASGTGADRYEGTSKAAHYFVRKDGHWALVFTLDRDQ
jgi:ketosteroid isomerase-like protein